MGAALQGAGLSAQFKTKDIRVLDKTPFAIELVTGSEKNTVYPLYGLPGQKTTLDFKRFDNFTIQANAVDAQQK
jgi:hypothetical protein